MAPKNPNLLILMKTNPEGFFNVPPGTKVSLKDIYHLAKSKTFTWGWDYPSLAEVEAANSTTWAEYRRAYHNRRKYEREMNIDRALSLGNNY